MSQRNGGRGGGGGGCCFSSGSQNWQQSIAFLKPLNIFNPRVTAVGLKEGQLVRFSFSAHFSIRLQPNFLEIQAKKLFQTVGQVIVFDLFDTEVNSFIIRKLNSHRVNIQPYLTWVTNGIFFLFFTLPIIV